MSRPAFRLCVVALVASLAATAPAFGLAGSLSSPGVAFSVTYPREAQSSVMAALNRKDCKFLSGGFVNWFTTLRYQGEARALSQQLADLATCPASTVQVSFQKLENACDWQIQHDGPPNHFHIAVNLNSKRLKLEDLSIPAAQGPALKPK